MSESKRPVAFWVIVLFLGFSIVAILFGQTLGFLDYDLAVSYGLQESLHEVGEYGVQVNRAFGAADTLVYLPLLVVSLLGLIQGKRWALLATAALAGVSAYWSTTIICMFLFLPGVNGYNYLPGPGIWLFVLAFLSFGIWALMYLLLRGERLLLRQ